MRWVLRLAFAIHAPPPNPRRDRQARQIFRRDQYYYQQGRRALRSRKRPFLPSTRRAQHASLRTWTIGSPNGSGQSRDGDHFLAVHGSGVHAQTATAEVDRLLSEQASAQTTPKVSNDTSFGAKAASDIVRPATLSSGTRKSLLSPQIAGSGSLRHETPVKARQKYRMARPQTRRQRARPCNPPRLPRGCRS